MPRLLNLFVVGYKRPDLLSHQKRLLEKYLDDPFELCVIDNSPDPSAAYMEKMCSNIGAGYQRGVSTKYMHNDALNQASRIAHDIGCDFWMTLDHDVFPRRKTTLINKIEQVGFYGIGQWHTPTQTRYLWPGFAGFSREWLNGRVPNFDGIRGPNKRDDGDCGSMLGQLFTEDEWMRLPRTEHGYLVIRPEDGYGLQSYGIEFFDDFIHFTNASGWMEIPDPNGRSLILNRMLEKL